MTIEQAVTQVLQNAGMKAYVETKEEIRWLRPEVITQLAQVVYRLVMPPGVMTKEEQRALMKEVDNEFESRGVYMQTEGFTETIDTPLKQNPDKPVTPPETPPEPPRAGVDIMSLLVGALSDTQAMASSAASIKHQLGQAIQKLQSS